MGRVLSRRTVLRLGVGVAVGGVAGGLVPSLAGAVATGRSGLVPPRNATQTFGMIRYGDRRHPYVAMKRRPSPETRTIRNQLKPSGTWTSEFHVFHVDWRALDDTEILIPTSLGAHSQVKGLAFQYADTLSLIPRSLRELVRTINVIPGTHNITGGGGHINIYTGAQYPAEKYPNLFVHEAAHTLNQNMRADPGALARWKSAVVADRRAGGPLGGFISEYAAENPDGEDFGESLNAWIALRNYPDRLNAIDTRYVPFIRSQIAHRIAFFKNMGLDMRPLPH